MIESYINKAEPEAAQIEYEGDYIDVLAELIWLNFFLVSKIAEEQKLNRNKLIVDVLEVVQENLEELQK